MNIIINESEYEVLIEARERLMKLGRYVDSVIGDKISKECIKKILKGE